MPELPEVRTVVKFLKKEIKGEILEDIIIRLPKMFDQTIKDKLLGQKLQDIKTRGKYIIFEFDDYDLISHLRMEGKYYKPTIKEFGKHDYVIFYFNNKEIRYHDTRKFGTFDLREKNETYKIPPLSLLALEPFDLSSDELYLSLKRRTSPIKSLLLNQHIIAGIGNIYADEILFEAKIHPLKKGNKITKNNAKAIIDSSVNVLNKAILMGGTTIYSFSSNGEVGWFLQELKVHLKEKEPCLVCGTPIEKIKVGGRSTYFCKVCQRK